FTGSAFRSCADKCLENTHHHSSEGTFLVTTPCDQPIHRWIEAKGETRVKVNRGTVGKPDGPSIKLSD
ncbi:hypothetical protein PXH80_29710, partial [Mycolicibacterium smegmatis]